MALRWENPASTTHSLTPSPSNRPLIFWILTPCEKPVATGSAGRCEPGVGRFTDPHPLTCYNITPSFCWLMFRLCALPSALSNPVLYVEENSAFYRGQSLALMRCLCRPSWACFFLFLLFPYLLSATSLSPVEVKSFFPYLGFAAAPGFVHNWLTRLQQGRYGAPLVSFPYLALKIAHRAVHGLFRFSPLPVPLFPYGEKSV